MADTYKYLIRVNPHDVRPFKLMKGKNDSTTFLPLKSKIGGLVRYVLDRENMCLTVDQAKYIYKKGRTRKHN